MEVVIIVEGEGPSKTNHAGGSVNRSVSDLQRFIIIFTYKKGEGRSAGDAGTEEAGRSEEGAVRRE